MKNILKNVKWSDCKLSCLILHGAVIEEVDIKREKELKEEERSKIDKIN